MHLHLKKKKKRILKFLHKIVSNFGIFSCAFFGQKVWSKLFFSPAIFLPKKYFEWDTIIAKVSNEKKKAPPPPPPHPGVRQLS